jgi:hypothetical protein
MGRTDITQVDADSIADQLRQMEVDLAVIRQKVAFLGVGVHSPYGEMLDAGGLLLSAARKIMRAVGRE